MRTEKVSTCSQAIRKRRNALEIKRGYKIGRAHV